MSAPALEIIPEVWVRLLDEKGIARHAAQMKPSMERALSRDTDMTPSDILTRALRGGILVWGAYDSGEFIGHVTALPQKDQLIILTLGGERAREWMPLINDHLRYLLDQGAYRSIVAGVRPGLVKWLRPLGWRPYRTLVELRQDG